MTDRDFETLMQLALLDLLPALEKFSASAMNRDVYAIALGVIAPGDAPSLYVNGRQDAAPFDEHERMDVYQERYNAFSFRYADHDVFSPDTVALFEKFVATTRALSDYQDTEAATSPAERRRIGQEWDRLYAGYYGSLFDVLNRLGPALEGISRAPDCVLYVDQGNNDEDARRRHFEATIPPALFAALFPIYRRPDTAAGASR